MSKNDKKRIGAVIITQEGMNELQAELVELKEVKMPKVVARISNAREQGDLSENADYHSAKDEQSMVNARIDAIEEILSKAEVTEKKSGSKVSLGSIVKVENGNNGKKYTYSLVGEYESNPSEGKISVESPVGKALMGKKKGDKCEVEVPAGKIVYKILELK